MYDAALFICIIALIVVSALYQRKINRSRQATRNVQTELDELTTNLYGSPQNYERSKHNIRECRTDREQKVAKESADKGITRASKQYPSRYKGTR